MRDEYDFLNGIKNPYAKKLKSKTTIRLDDEVKEYFQDLALKEGIPYQTLINLYLKDCMKTGRRPALSWNASEPGNSKKKR